MKQLLLQAFNLIRQNPFYATISIIGTAVTIAFVMVVVMIYDFRTMDMAPESDRSDMMYTGSGMTYRKLDHTMASVISVTIRKSRIGRYIFTYWSICRCVNGE